jgi:predicted NBD/HSP70 family sugar kinase
MKPANRDTIRAINQFNVLNTIRRVGLISRVEIAEMTGQSRASVTNITAHLIKEKLIYEKETRDTTMRGRRRVMLALNPEAAYVVGVKLSAFRMSCAVTDMQAEVRSSVVMPVRTSKRPASFVANMIEEGIRHCVKDARLDLDQISGIGIGVPGFVDQVKGTCHWSPLYEKGDVPLRDLVENRLKIPTYMENDANTVTLSHQWFGDGKSVSNFIVITIEDGVGMGIVVNGQMYRGATGIGAEFGHVVIDPGGAPCRCGKQGCLEAYVSDFSIVAAAKKAVENNLWIPVTSSDLTVSDVIKAANAGVPALVEIFHKAGRVLGNGISGIIQIFNPDRIIISGQGVKAGDLMFRPMREAIAEFTNQQQFADTEIIIHKWKDIDWARGAASLVLQELYKSPHERIRTMI